MCSDKRTCRIGIRSYNGTKRETCSGSERSHGGGGAYGIKRGHVAREDPMVAAEEKHAIAAKDLVVAKEYMVPKEDA